MILPEFLSFGKIDDHDVLSQLGFAVESGSDSFMQPAQPKERFFYEWPDQPGKEYDLYSETVLQSRIFVLNGWLLANNMTEFKTKYEFLKELLYSVGYRTIYCKKYDIEVNCILKSFPKWEAPAGVSFKNNNYVGIELSIEFDEVSGLPDDFYLTDENDNILVDMENNLITSEN